MSFEFGILSFEIFSLSFEIVGLSFKISGLLLLSFKRFFQKTLYHLICKIACLVLKSYFYFSSEVSNVMCLRGNTYTGCTFATLVAGNLSFEKNYWVFAKNPAEFWNFLSFGAAEFFSKCWKKKPGSIEKISINSNSSGRSLINSNSSRRLLAIQ